MNLPNLSGQPVMWRIRKDPAKAMSGPIDGAPSPAPTGAAPTGRPRRSPTAWIIRWFRSPGATQWSIARGVAQRLPTEPEWEFAARGVDGRRYAWASTAPAQSGPLPARRANYGADGCCAADDTDGFRTTAPVGSFPAGVSPYGLHDMAGNVWEWTTSRFSGQPGWYVIKGGGWGNNPYCLRVAYKHGNPSDIGLDMVGFRCAADESGRVRR